MHSKKKSVLIALTPPSFLQEEGGKTISIKHFYACILLQVLLISVFMEGGI